MYNQKQLRWLQLGGMSLMASLVTALSTFYPLPRFQAIILIAFFGLFSFASFIFYGIETKRKEEMGKMFNRETNKPLVDLDPEQRSTIYRRLCQFNLENYQQYVEEIILSHGDLPLLLNLIACIFEEGQKDIRERLLQLENMKLTGITGGKR